jgi:antirestriction protein ArdC
VLHTQHLISNIRIEVKDGGREAYLTCSAMSYDVKEEDAFEKEDTSYTASSVYEIEMVQGDDGLWRIKKWDISVRWTVGDIKVLHPDV